MSDIVTVQDYPINISISQMGIQSPSVDVSKFYPISNPSGYSSLLFFNGAPEGSIAANSGIFGIDYFNNKFYIKTTGVSVNGWVSILGWIP